MVDQDAVVFAQELVEADGAAHGKRKKSGDVTFTKMESTVKLSVKSLLAVILLNALNGIKTRSFR